MIYISLGSNLGNRLLHLQQAVQVVTSRYLKNSECSIVLETKSLLPPGAPSDWDKPYLNMIIRGESDLTPHDLLAGLKKIEIEMGRPLNHERWSPRIIDLDILLWGDVVLNTEALTLPHPEISHRDFLIHLLSMMNPISTYNTNLPLTISFSKSFVLSPKLVGVVNVTADSFSDGGLYNKPENALQQVLQLAEDGASVIELGAQATSPNALLKTPEAEYAQLEPLLKALNPKMKTRELTISIDTFSPRVIHKILDNYPVAWINDVKGNMDEATLKKIAEHNCQFVAMHSLSIPADKKIVLPSHIAPIEIILEWAHKTLDHLLKIGFTLSSIILDPGIGFGKSAFQDLAILREIDKLSALGCKVLVGHSRKYFIKSFSSEAAADRDLETLAISSHLKNKVAYLRVHNVKDHQRFLVANHSSLLPLVGEGARRADEGVL